MTSAPKVVEFPPTRADLPGSLRRFADKIERGEYGEARFVVAALVSAEDGIAVFGWGKSSDLECVGAFTRAAPIAGQCIVLNESSPEDGA